MHLQHSDHAPVSAGHGPVVGNRSFYHFVFSARADHPGYGPVLSWTRPVSAGHSPVFSWAQPHAQLGTAPCSAFFLFLLWEMLSRSRACHVSSFSLYLCWIWLHFCFFCSFKLF